MSTFGDAAMNYAKTNMMLNSIGVGNYNVGRASTAESIVGGIFDIGTTIAAVAIAGKGASGGSSVNSSKQAALSTLQNSEIQIQVTQDEIKRLKGELLSDDDYKKEKAKLEEQLTTLDKDYGIKNSEGTDDTEIKSLQDKYDAASAAFDTATDNVKKAGELDAQMSKLASKPLLSQLGDTMDITNDTGAPNKDNYTSKFGDSASQVYNKDLTKWQTARNNYIELQSQKTKLGDVNEQLKTAETNKENAAKALNAKLNGGNGNDTVKLQEYQSKKAGIKSQLTNLDVRHSNNTTVLAQIKTLEGTLSTFKQNQSLAQNYLDKLEEASDDVAAAKTAKKNYKDRMKGHKGGNFFQRLIGKGNKDERQTYKAALNVQNQNIADAKAKYNALSYD